MSNRLIFVLLLTATLYASAASLIGLSSATPAGGAWGASAMAEPADAIPVLPAVVVRAALPPTRLPTITVRPAPEEIAAALAGADDNRVGTLVPVGHVFSGGTLMAGPSFDMPYYSFGKSLYRVSKE